MLEYDGEYGDNEPLGSETLDICPWFLIEQELEEVIGDVLAATDYELGVLEKTSEGIDNAVREAVQSDETGPGEGEESKGGYYAV